MLVRQNIQKHQFTAEPRAKKAPTSVIMSMSGYEKALAYFKPLSMGASAPIVFYPPNPADGVNYKDLGALPLFSGDPSMHDVHQGYTSERCWYISVLASMALQMKDQLRSIVVQVSQNLYRVRSVYNGVDEWDYVNAQIPENGEQIWDSCIWVNIAEKAMARRRTGANTYASLQYGSAYEALTDLGFTARNYSPTDPSFWPAAAIAFSLGLPVLLGSVSSPPSGSPIPGSHFCSFTGVDPVAKTASIYNPWGILGPLGDGTMTLSWNDVQQSTAVFTVATSFARPQPFADATNVPQTAPTVQGVTMTQLPPINIPLTSFVYSGCKLETSMGRPDFGWLTTEAGGYIESTISVPATGTYLLCGNYAAIAACSGTLTINGVAPSAPIVNFSATGNAFPAAPMPFAIQLGNLPAGAAVLRLTHNAGSQYNIFDGLFLVKIG